MYDTHYTHYIINIVEGVCLQVGVAVLGFLSLVSIESQATFMKGDTGLRTPCYNCLSVSAMRRATGLYDAPYSVSLIPVPDCRGCTLTHFHQKVYIVLTH